MVLEKPTRVSGKGDGHRDDLKLPSSVLVIDDSPSDRLLLVEILKEVDTGVNVTTSGSLKEALEAIAASNFDVVLLDLGLPDTEGLEGLLVLSDQMLSTPIIVVSAHPGDAIVFEALNYGADEFLSKSDISPRNVRDAMLRALGRRAGRRHHDRSMASAVRALDMIQTPAVSISTTGQIIATNGAWNQEANENGGTASATGVGANYLTVCRRAVGDDSYGALEVAVGIEKVLEGERDNFSFDYPCFRFGLERWFNVRVVPLTNSGGGAVITHVDVTQSRRAEEDLRRHQSLLQTSNEVIFSPLYAADAQIFALVDVQGTVLHMSKSTRSFLGNERLNSNSSELLARVDLLDLERASVIFARVAATPGESEAALLRVIDRNGHQRTLDLTLINLLHDPAVNAIAVSGSDITASRNEQIGGRIESKLLDMIPVSVVVTDYSGTIVYWNERASNLYGYPASVAIGQTIKEMGVRPDAETNVDAIAMAIGRWEGDILSQRDDGVLISEYSIVQRIEAPDIDFKGVVTSSMDVKDRLMLEESLQHQTRHDAVTGLPNRRQLIERVDAALQSQGDGDEPLGLLFIDFDEFWAINDRYGYQFGNETLIAWSNLVLDVLSPMDFLAHLGGDEFAICLRSATSTDDVMKLARELRDISSGVVQVGAQTVTFTTTIGVALSTPTSSAEGLIRDADSAMYRAKEFGKAQIEVFDADRHNDLRVRANLRLELAKAVENHEIEAYFQPVLSLSSGEIVGFEALARWENEARTPPTVFIPLAEESGLISVIGAMMLQASCEALSAWKLISPNRQLSVAVNVSARQLLDPTFTEMVRETCSRNGVDPENICLEITETALADEDVIFHVLHELKAVGVSIAIDDFGTGYSSLLRLHRFPVDFLKIDRSFVDELKMAERDSVVITAILGIASALNIRVIAEGIEDELQRQRLLEMGCEEGQGFLFSRAVTLDAATLLVATAYKYVAEDSVAESLS
jgi:diguanylate cyclase (GGDEF)-like protein/PAS domain S-box-containing protein